MPKTKGKLPHHAVVGGREGNKKLYVCRAKLSDGIHPGETGGRVCVVAYKGKAQEFADFEVATGRGLKWSPGNWKSAIIGSLQFGTMDLYVCRARVDGYVIPGKAYGRGPHKNHCFVPYQGRELDFAGDFELLHASEQGTRP